jgi:hypothetical protein
MPVTDVPDLGSGATIAFSTTTFAAKVRKITLPDIGVEEYDVSTLDTNNHMKTIAGDLKNAGSVVVTILAPSGLTLPTIATTPETCTVTFPLRANGGEAGAATFAGTGFFKRYKHPELAVGVVQEAEYEFRFDGSTGPAFTKST